MWIKLEGEQLINLDLVERVELLHQGKVAKLWAGSIFLHESAIAYRYFTEQAEIIGIPKAATERGSAWT